MVYKFFDSKVASSDKKAAAEPSAKHVMGSGTTKSSSLERTAKPRSLILADELHKPVIKKVNKRKVYSQFKDNIWGVDLADMRSLSKKKKRLNIFYVL